MAFVTKVYTDENGDRQVVASGGELQMESGATLDVQSGATETHANNPTFSGTPSFTSTLAQYPKAVVEAHTADDTLTAAETGTIHTNTGASGTITLILPAAVVGLEFPFQVGAAQQLRIDPNGSETISLPLTGVAGAAGKYLVADAIGETVVLKCAIAGTWGVFGFTGTWTAEA